MLLMLHLLYPYGSGEPVEQAPRVLVRHFSRVHNDLHLSRDLIFFFFSLFCFVKTPVYEVFGKTRPRQRDNNPRALARGFTKLN